MQQVNVSISAHVHEMTRLGNPDASAMSDATAAAHKRC